MIFRAAVVCQLCLYKARGERLCPAVLIQACSLPVVADELHSSLNQCCARCADKQQLLLLCCLTLMRFWNGIV